MPFLGSIIVATVSDCRVSVYHLTATAAAVERIICILTISYDLVIKNIIFGAIHYTTFKKRRVFRNDLIHSEKNPICWAATKVATGNSWPVN